MYIKLNHHDIANSLAALEDYENPTDSEKRTIDKLRMILAIQNSKKTPGSTRVKDSQYV